MDPDERPSTQMTIRISPEPDRFAVSPPGDGPLLSFYRDVFEAVFVLLHPFLRPTGITLERFLGDPDVDRDHICRTCEAVSWAQVQQLGSFSSLAEIDIALRTQIRGLREGFASPILAKQLQSCLDESGLVQPVEGRFSELTHDKVLAFLQEEGHSWVWVGDEFGTERKLHWIDDLKKPDSDATEGRRSVFTPDKSILWTTHWDSHFAFVCGSSRMIDRMVNDKRFEGFRCEQDTPVYWSLHQR